MAIKALGESLLSSAKKKAKRGQKLGQLAGLAMIGMNIANRNIRNKAIQRANEWNNSFTPLKKMYEGEFTKINDTKDEYTKRNDTTTYANYQESFYEPEIERLTKLITGKKTDGTLSPKEIADIRVQAIENVSDNVLKYETAVNQYQPYFNIDQTEFINNLKTLRSTGTKYISDDNLQKVLGRKLFNSTEGQMIKRKINLSDTEAFSLDIPQELYQSLDLEFLNALDGMKTRSVKVSDVKIIREAYGTAEDIEILQKKIKRDPPAKPLTKDTQAAIVNIFTEFDGEDLEGNPLPNVDYLEFINFSNDKNKVVAISMQDLKTVLESTFDGGKPRVKPEQNFSDWDQYMKDVAVLTQAQEVEYLRLNRNEVVTQQMRKQFAARAAVEVAGTFDITFKTGNVGMGKYNPLRILPGLGMKEGIISTTYKGRKGSEVPNEEGIAGDTNTLDTSGTFNAVNLEEDLVSFDVEAARIDLDTPEFKAMSQEDKSNYFYQLKIMHPESVTEINKLRQSVLAPKPLEEKMQETLSDDKKVDDMTRIDGTTKSDIGYKGPIKNNVTGQTMTEVSISFDDFENPYSDKNIIPLIVPTLTDKEISILQDMEIEGNAKNIPQAIKTKAIDHARLRIKAGLNPFYQDGEEDTPPPSPTPAPKDSLLSPNIPTQAELVKDFEILGADQMSSEEIDARLNEMINQKDDFTTDEYIKLITYLNSKQGIMPQATSLLEPTPELTDSEIIANALKGSGTGRNPLEVIDDMNIRNQIKGTNLGLKTLQRDTSTARQAIAMSGLLRKKDFVEFLESEGTTKDEFQTTTKDYVLNIFNKYLKQLQSK
jgi:hypothetical protein